MDFNKITAQLDFVESSIHSIETKANMVRIPQNAKKSFGIDIKYSNPVVNDDSKFGRLLMLIEICIENPDDITEPDTIKVLLEGLFKSTKDLEDEKFMQLLNINGGAALLSIARSKIEVLSSLTYSDGKIVLPMINIVQYFSERNTDTTEQ